MFVITNAVRLLAFIVVILFPAAASSDSFSLEQVLTMLYGDNGTMNTNLRRVSDLEDAKWSAVSGVMTSELISKQTAFGTTPGEIATLQVNDGAAVTPLLSDEIPFTDRAGMALVERQGPTALIDVGFGDLVIELDRGGRILSSDEVPDRMLSWEIIGDDFALIDPEDVGNFVIAWEDLSPPGDSQDWLYEVSGVSPVGGVAKLTEPTTVLLLTIGLLCAGYAKHRHTHRRKQLCSHRYTLSEEL